MPLTYNHAIVLIEFSLPACADPSPLSFSSQSSGQTFSHNSVTMPNRGRRNPRNLSRTRQGPAANALNTEQTNYRSMATEALRLLLAQHNLVQTGTRQQLVARLETHFKNPPSGGVTVTDTPSSTHTLPQEELAQIISSLIEEKLAARQDSGQQHSQLVPSPHTGSHLTVPSPPTPSSTQDGGQPQQQSVATLPPAIHAFSPSSGSQQQQQSVATPPPFFPAFNPSDPANVAALHPDFRQPSLASHLTKTTTTAITNGEYVDFATLLPISSLLEQARNSQLHLQVGAQGVTIPLPATSKRPKITSIEKWLDAFAIFSSVLVSIYPSRAAALIAYQQLIRDAVRKFPGMAWYVYDVEFRRRASHNLSLNWGERDVQLYLDTFTGLPNSGCRTCSSSDHHADSCPLSPPRSRDSPNRSDLCYNFNNGRPCARSPCPYKHRCNQPGCNATHSGQDHSKLSRSREDRLKSSMGSSNSSRSHS